MELEAQNNKPLTQNGDSDGGCSVRAGTMNLSQAAELQRRYKAHQAGKSVTLAAQVPAANTASNR